MISTASTFSYGAEIQMRAEPFLPPPPSGEVVSLRRGEAKVFGVDELLSKCARFRLNTIDGAMEQ